MKRQLMWHELLNKWEMCRNTRPTPVWPQWYVMLMAAVSQRSSCSRTGGDFSCGVSGWGAEWQLSLQMRWREHSEWDKRWCLVTDVDQKITFCSVAASHQQRRERVPLWQGRVLNGCDGCSWIYVNPDLDREMIQRMHLQLYWWFAIN